MRFHGLAFASDFDNTLYFRDREPHCDMRDLEAIRAFRAQGGLFGLSTGRSLTGVLRLADDFPADVIDFFVLASGANVLDGTGARIASREIPRSVASAIWQGFAHRTGVVIQANDTVYTLAEPLPFQVHVDSVDEIPGSVWGLSFGTGSTEHAHELAAEVMDAFGEAVTAFPNAHNVDIAPRGCSKGTGLSAVRSHFGVGRVGAIGDSFNDLAMADEAEAFYTFFGSPQALRQRATGCVGSVREALGRFLDTQ